jgi:hypothetical protein
MARATVRTFSPNTRRFVASRQLSAVTAPCQAALAPGAWLRVGSSAVDIDRELRTLAASARPRAVLMLGAGIAVAASFAVYVAFLAWVLRGTDRFPLFTFLYASGFGAIPLVLGLVVVIRGVTRLRVLTRVVASPHHVVAAELAFRFGQPAVRLRLHDESWVVIASGELDRSQLDRAIRSRLDGAGRAPAGPYR